MESLRRGGDESRLEKNKAERRERCDHSKRDEETWREQRGRHAMGQILYRIITAGFFHVA